MKVTRATSVIAALALGLLSAVLISAAVAADHADLPGPIVRDGFDLAPVGGDELSLFGLRVYRASLWAPGGRYQPDQPSAFSLRYQRDFSRERLVEITLAAWEKGEIGSGRQRQAWAQGLLDIWEDVNAGDLLTALVVPGRETRFYSATGVLGRIEDKEFGPAFLGIWLDEQTQLPELRTALLGLKRAS